MKTQNIIQRLSFFLFALILVATAWADDVMLQNDNGTEYANMAQMGINRLSNPQGMATFRTYIAYHEAEYFEIASKEDWKQFCQLVNTGQNTLKAKLTTDIDLGNTSDDNEILSMVLGNDSHPYSGMLDGNGHTLTLNWTGNYAYGLIGIAQNATIRNLCLKGSLSSTGFMGGLIYYARENIDIANCWVAIDFSSKDTWEDTTGGAFIGIVNDGCTISIIDCVVSSKFNGTNVKNWNGFVARKKDDSTLKLASCLYMGNNANSNGYTFAPNPTTLEKCYYLNACGKDQGDRVMEQQLKNGEITKRLQGNRTDRCYWAQTLGETPSLFNENKVEEENYLYYNTDEARWRCDNVMITDDRPLPKNANFWTNFIRNTRTLGANGLYTLCLPYNIELPQGVKAYLLKEVDMDKRIARFSPITETTLQRAVPYLIKTGGEEMSLTVDAKATYTSTDIYEVGPDSNTGNETFRGSFAYMNNTDAATADAYVLQDDDKFHKVTNDDTSAVVPPYRAYLSAGSNPCQGSVNILRRQFHHRHQRH